MEISPFDAMCPELRQVLDTGDCTLIVAIWLAKLPHDKQMKFYHATSRLCPSQIVRYIVLWLRRNPS